MEPNEEKGRKRRRRRKSRNAVSLICRVKKEKGSETLREQSGEQVSKEARGCDSRRRRKRSRRRRKMSEMWQRCRGLK